MTARRKASGAGFGNRSDLLSLNLLLERIDFTH